MIDRKTLVMVELLLSLLCIDTPEAMSEYHRQNPFKKAPESLRVESLDAIHFVGVLKQGLIKWALISQPSGLILTVKEGDLLGRHDGHVMRIDDEVIEIEETVKTGSGLNKKRVIFNLQH